VTGIIPYNGDIVPGTGAISSPNLDLAKAKSQEMLVLVMVAYKIFTILYGCTVTVPGTVL
jgi:hypothetical protein